MIALSVCASIISCSKDDILVPVSTEPTEQTVFMYMPWSSNLTSYFETNINDFENAIKRKASENERVVVFFASSKNKATLFEMRYFNGEVIRRELKSYNVSTFTTANDIATLINDVKSLAPAKRYAMIVSCHGMGWLPVVSSKARDTEQKDYWEYEGALLTRYFGGLSPEYQIDITVFAEGIAASETKMEYILFDDCYLANVEVAYDLKEVTDYLIASPTEVMAFGFPYNEIGGYLLGDVDYKAIVQEFYSFYNSFQHPYGTIGVISCQEVDHMANIMQQINSSHTFSSNVNSLQRMDGYTPIIFFDFGDYVNNLCDDPNLLNRFHSQLEKLVPYSANTKEFYSMSRGSISVDHYSGITISDPSLNSKAITKTETAWYKATH